MTETIQKIKEQFDKVISYSQGIPTPQTDALFDDWLHNKKCFIECFNGEFIYEWPEKVSFELSEKEQEERINNFIDMCFDLDLGQLGTFLVTQRKGFFNNIVVNDFSLDDSSKKTITKNTKLIKAFKYFIKEDSLLNTVQSKASQLIQENKIEGTLCFSVHPLDYLSLSENAHNWRSCHALDGEYRAGNLSYMIDDSTIICYLKSNKETKLPNFPEDVPWNSKKWRVLLYLSNDWKMIFAGKQYPFSTSKGMQFILDKCFNNNRDEQIRWSDWTDYNIHKINHKGMVYNFWSRYIPVSDGKNGLVKIEDLVIDAEGSKHFNDVLKSSCYIPIYTQLAAKSFWSDDYRPKCKETTRFLIGGKTKCLHCGEDEVLEAGGTMRCYDCEFIHGTTENEYFGFCSSCGERIVIEDGYWIEDEAYCKDCFDNLSTKCSICEDYYLENNIVYDEYDNKYYCHWCYKHRKGE